MQNWRQIAMEAKDILTVCLAKSIDQALIAQCGDDWFAEFAQADLKEKPGTQITKPGQQSVRDMDMQALLKILRFRPTYANRILAHYSFFDGMDTFGGDAQTRQLRDLLDRLITDFRNRIEAHTRAADIEKELSGQDIDRIYGYEDAYQDMCKLARIFSTTTDRHGVSYYSRIVALAEKKEKKKKPLLPILAGAAAALALIIGLLVALLPLGPSNIYESHRSPVVKHGEISVQPIEVYYDGKELVAVCYIINGTDQTVSSIQMESLRLTEQGRDIAAASFGTLTGITLAPGESVKWQFSFPEKTVLAYDAHLPDLQLQFSCHP